MNQRLLQYLRSLGLAKDASDDAALDFLEGLRGVQAIIANNLNYTEDDEQARTSCDLAIRSLGFDPSAPHQELGTEREQQGSGVATIVAGVNASGNRSASPTVGSDGASTGGDLERALDAARQQERLAERNRLRGIRDVATLAGVPDSMRQRAEDEGWTLDRATTAFSEHRSQRMDGVPPDLSGSPAGHSRSSQTGHTRDALVAAMLLREGVSDPTQAWPTRMTTEGMAVRENRASDAAVGRAVDHGADLSRLSLAELVVRALELDGVRNVYPTAPSIAAAMQQRSGVGFANLTGMFTMSYAAMLLDGYEAAPDTTAGWTREQGVRDYKQNDRMRMGPSARLQRRRAHQEAKQTTFEDSIESYRVFEYASQFDIDEQDLINDTFGALNDYTPRDMGIAAAELRPDLAYTVLMQNANMRDGVALFNAAHGNVLTSSALGMATLEAARALMFRQREGDRNLNLRARYLIGPATLESTIDGLIEALMVVTGSDVLRPNYNSNARAGLVKVCDARLDNGVVDPNTGTAIAGSTSTWFLSGPTPMIEIGYVRQLGNRPRVRTKLHDSGRFGINFDVQHSLGAKALDWRGLTRATA